MSIFSSDYNIKQRERDRDAELKKTAKAAQESAHEAKRQTDEQKKQTNLIHAQLEEQRRANQAIQDDLERKKNKEEYQEYVENLLFECSSFLETVKTESDFVSSYKKCLNFIEKLSHVSQNNVRKLEYKKLLSDINENIEKVHTALILSKDVKKYNSDILISQIQTRNEEIETIKQEILGHENSDISLNLWSYIRSKSMLSSTYYFFFKLFLPIPLLALFIYAPNVLTGIAFFISALILVYTIIRYPLYFLFRKKALIKEREKSRDNQITALNIMIQSRKDDIVGYQKLLEQIDELPKVEY